MTTGIEWTDETWNPVTGCSKVSQGCKNCYAERLFPRPYPGRAFTDVRTHPDRLSQPARWVKGRRIFVNSMSDLFHEDVPFEFIDRVFAAMWFTTRHTYQVLTKRPARMLEYFTSRLQDVDGFGHPRAIGDAELAFAWMPANGRRGGYDNCGPAWPLENLWLGVSVEDQATADERVPLLLQTPAAVRFISAEPLLAPVDISRWLGIGGKVFSPVRPGQTSTYYDGLNWVIAGGESGPKARPSHPDWFRSLRDQCAAAAVPYFFKQWGEWWEVGHELREEGKAVEIDADSLETEEWFQKGDKFIALDGRTFDAIDQLPDDETPCRLMTRVGKKAAGRQLDGRTHDEYPA